MKPPTHADIDIAQLRRNYQRDGLRRADLDADPVAQFRRWFHQATAAELLEPNAMVLSTSDGVRPSSRTVLLKAFNARASCSSPITRGARPGRLPSIPR